MTACIYLGPMYDVYVLVHKWWEGAESEAIGQKLAVQQDVQRRR